MIGGGEGGTGGPKIVLYLRLSFYFYYFKVRLGQDNFRVEAAADPGKAKGPSAEARTVLQWPHDRLIHALHMIYMYKIERRGRDRKGEGV